MEDDQRELIEIVNGFDMVQTKLFLEAAISSPNIAVEVKNKFKKILVTFSSA